MNFIDQENPSKCPWATHLVQAIFFGEIMVGFFTERIYSSRFYLHAPIQMTAIFFGLLADTVVPKWIIVLAAYSLGSLVGVFEILIQFGVVYRSGGKPEFLMALDEVMIATESVRILFSADQLSSIYYKAYSRRFFFALFWFHNLGRIFSESLFLYSTYNSKLAILEILDEICNLIYLAGLFIFLKSFNKVKPVWQEFRDIFKCILYAAHKRVRGIKPPENPNRWLYIAQDKYSRRVILESKATIDVMVYLMPVAATVSFFFMSLHITKVQNKRMRSYFINDSFSVPVVLIQRVLISVLLPIIELIFIPCLVKRAKATNTRALLASVLVIILAFTAGSIVSVAIGDKQELIPQEGSGQVKIFNALPYSVKLQSDWPASVEYTIPKYGYFSLKKLEGTGRITKTITLYEKMGERTTPNLHQIVTYEKKSKSFVLTSVGLIRVVGDDPVEEEAFCKNTHAFILCGLAHCDGTLYFNCPKGFSYNISVPQSPDERRNIELEPCKYKIVYKRDQDKVIEHQAVMGEKGVYAVVLSQANSSKDMVNLVVHTIIEPYVVYWYALIPQIFFLAIAEILLTVAVQDFTFTQSPSQTRALILSSFVMLSYAITTAARVFLKNFYYSALQVLVLDNACLLLAMLLLFLNIKYKYFDWFTSVPLQEDTPEDLGRGKLISSRKRTESEGSFEQVSGNLRNKKYSK